MDDLQFDLFRPMVIRFLALYPNEEFGAGHVVLSDDNYDNDSIQFCLNELSESIDDDNLRYFLQALQNLNTILMLDEI